MIYIFFLFKKLILTNIKCNFFNTLKGNKYNMLLIFIILFQAFYIDAVKFLPEDMSEILDLLIEKELRLHTTPEELDILRD